MESGPINDGPVVQMLTLFVVESREYLQRLWKPFGGLLSILGIYVKVNPYPNLAEAHAIQFVGRNTSIPVPKIYCAFVRRGATYIVMSRIDGQMVRQGWYSRSENSKARILNQLQSLVAELRPISPPKGMGVANVNGGSFYDCRLPSRLFWGPFASVRRFHEALADGFDLEADYVNLPADLHELFAFYRRSRGDLVFTHGESKQPKYSITRRQSCWHRRLGDGRMVSSILGVHLCQKRQPLQFGLGGRGGQIPDADAIRITDGKHQT